jgi:hypothetical protein
MRVRTVSAVLMLVLLTACRLTPGQDTTQRPASTPASQLAEIKEAAQSFWDDIFTGQGPNAYTWISHRCQLRVDVEAFSDLVIRLGNGYGGPPLQFTRFRARVTGDHAVLAYSFKSDVLRGYTGDHWVRDPEGWRWDSCDQPPHAQTGATA